MKLFFQKQLVEIISVHSTEEIIDKINKLLGENFYFSHFVADGQEVYEDTENFLKNNILNINTLEIVALSAGKFINDLLLSAEEYTERAVIQIPKLYNEFYANPSSTSWANLEELFEGIQWMSTMMEVVNQSVERPSNWNEVRTHVSSMQAELSSLEEALVNADTVLIADILQYEILPVLDTISVIMKRTIDTEGVRHDLT